MRQIKRRIESFSFFNQVGISAHLEKMAAKGWMIEKLTNFFWIYRRIDPKNVKFAVSYYPKASEFDPEPTEGQKMFHEFCAHTGWQLVCTSAQLQIFYNENENPIPIETEPELELESIHASAKRSFFPSYALLTIVTLLQGLLFISSLLGDPIGLFASPTRLFTGFCVLLLATICLVEMISYICWYSRAKKAVVHGTFLSPPNTSVFHKVILGAVLVAAVYFLVNSLFSGDPMRRWLILLLCVIYPVIYATVNGVKNYLKRKKASRGINRTLTIATSFVMSFALMSIITFGTLWLSRQGFFAGPEEETYEHGGMTWVIHNDELPLTVEDLLDVEYDGYIRERRGDESLLLGQMVLHQRPRFDAEDYRDMPSLEYTMVVVKMPFLYDMCKNRLLSKPGDTHPSLVQTYQKDEAAPWGAVEAYRLYDPEYGARNRYLLCYDRVIVEIRFDWEVTEEQKAIVGEKIV